MNTLVGTSFTNGQGSSALHARCFNWGEQLTVVRQDRSPYTDKRYVVVDRQGRHGFAFATA